MKTKMLRITTFALKQNGQRPVLKRKKITGIILEFVIKRTCFGK